jgi:AbrB family looped-hinge helix DNA binding protein
MNTVTISSKYQVVIPRSIREQFDLKPGQKIMFIPYKKTLRIVIVLPIEEAEGMFAGIDTDPYREKVDREL